MTTTEMLNREAKAAKLVALIRADGKTAAQAAKFDALDWWKYNREIVPKRVLSEMTRQRVIELMWQAENEPPA